MARRIVLIGGSKSNVGKTTFIRFILQTFPLTFTALKITNNKTHGLGIVEETFKTAIPNKDTYFFLENAKKVFWAKGDFDFLLETLPNFLSKLDGPIIAEGNVLFDIVPVDLFFFVERVNFEMKAHVDKFKDASDFIVVNGDYNFKVEGKQIFINLEEALLKKDNRLKDFLSSVFYEKIFV